MAGGSGNGRGRARTLVVAAVLALCTGAGAVAVAVAEGRSSVASVSSDSPTASPTASPSTQASDQPSAAGVGGGQARSTEPHAATGADADSERDGIAYVALGDSYASGQGGGDYSDGRCLRSSAGYPALLDAEPGINLVADASCSGDTIADLLSEQLGALSADTELVTITIGGNDLGAIRVAAVCSVSPSSADCRTMLTAALTLLEPGGELEQRLLATFARVRAEAPNARIIATGYPDLFEGTAFGTGSFATGADNESLIATLQGATRSLNADIEAAVLAERRAGSDIAYADVTGAFAGHGVGSADEWILSTGPDVFHPEAVGYVAYADAIRGALD
ncbi:SGNH/GDSL hydrolase family protein [Microbacteriaceae bacterium 4G12]